MYNSEHIMGILIASTAFAGLTGVVISQVQGQISRYRKRVVSLLAWSCMSSLPTILSTLAWFVSWNASTAGQHATVLLELANLFFMTQMILFWIGAGYAWLTE